MVINISFIVIKYIIKLKGGKIKNETREYQLKEIFLSMANNLDEELDLLKNEEKLLKILKKEINFKMEINPPVDARESCNFI